MWKKYPFSIYQILEFELTNKTKQRAPALKTIILHRNLNHLFGMIQK